MNGLEERLQYAFQDRSLLETALTHPSYAGDYHVRSYQRLEFLGDAVLELAVSRHLYQALPKVDEGTLSRIRAKLVREETLAKAARRIGLGACIRLSVGEIRSGGADKPSILADVMEAVFAAVYMDGGQAAAEDVIFRVLEKELHAKDLSDCLDEKSKLQEALQRIGHMPTYTLVSAEGPQHAPTFRYRVLDGDRPLGEGEGPSKQSAQQAAARSALEKLGDIHCD